MRLVQDKFRIWPTAGIIAPGGEQAISHARFGYSGQVAGRDYLISIDIFPTILSIIGLEQPDQQLDGISLTPLLFNNNHQIDRDAIFWHFPAYLEGNYEGARDEYFRTRPCGVVKADNWKLIHYFEKNEFELYNLEDDPGETNNLVELFPDRFKELKNILSEWQLKVNAPIPSELNPDFTGKD